MSYDEYRQEWRIGVEAYRTGASYLKNSDVVEIARPIMRRLMQDTGETANLAKPAGGSVVFVSQVESNNPIRAFFHPVLGRRCMPLASARRSLRR